MKKLLSPGKWLTAILLLIFAMTAGSAFADQTSNANVEIKIKALIVYYSGTNNTRHMAEFIQGRTGFDMEELELVTPYIHNYEELLEQVREEERRSYVPPLKPLKSDLASYDVVFVGSPLWIYTLSSPVMSFLNTHDLSGKIVIPFSARGTSPADRLYAKFAELCSDCRLMKGFDITRGGFNDAQPAFAKWLNDTVSELEKSNVR